MSDDAHYKLFDALGVVEPGEVQIPVAYRLGIERGDHNSEREPGTECKGRFRGVVLDYDTRYRAGYQRHRKRHESSLNTQEQSAAGHEVNVPAAHSSSFRDQLDKQQRNADYESTDDVRIYRDIVACVIEDDVDHGKHTDEDADEGRDQLCVPVHKEHYHKSREDQRGDDEIHGMCHHVELVSREYPQQRVEGLNHGVARRDLRSAGAAFALEYAPAHDRDKIAAFDLGAAAHTMRVAFDEGFLLRQTVDADIEKAAHAGAEQENKKIDYSTIDVILGSQSGILLIYGFVYILTHLYGKYKS